MRIDRDKPVALNSLLGRPRPGGRKRWMVLAGAGLVIAALSAFSFKGGTGQSAARAAAETAISKQARPLRTKVDCSARPTALQDKLTGIAADFGGKAGIAVTKAGCDWIVGARLGQYFPQQSVSKLWVALTVLDAVDTGKMRLQQPLTIRPQDLTLFNQPLRWEVLEKGSVTRPAGNLIKDAMSLSDNTANDRLLWTVGGPDRVRALLRARQIEGIRFGPGERLLQSEVAGLRWSQDLADGSNFEQARARLGRDKRQVALDRYVANPIDGATPDGLARALARLARGELLSPTSTVTLMDIMARSRSGPRRLKGGVPRGWTVYHKTGTGQELGSLATGYNDVAVFEAPDGTFYGVAVMVGATREPIQARMAMMQSVSRAVARFHAAGSGI